MTKSLNFELDFSDSKTVNKELFGPLNALLKSSHNSQTSNPEIRKLNDISTSDITVKIEPDGPLIFAHRSVLETNSFFAALQKFKEWKTGLINLESKYPKGIEYCLEYLYELERKKPGVVIEKSYFDNLLVGNRFVEVLICADYLQMVSLVDECYKRFSVNFESKIASPTFVYTELHFEIFRKIMTACNTPKIDAVSKLRVILTWTKGFTGDNEMLKTSDIYAILNSSIKFTERKTLTTVFLLKLSKEFANFDFVIPFSFSSLIIKSYQCRGCDAVLNENNIRSSCHSNYGGARVVD